VSEAEKSGETARPVSLDRQLFNFAHCNLWRGRTVEDVARLDKRSQEDKDNMFWRHSCYRRLLAWSCTAMSSVEELVRPIGRMHMTALARESSDWE
jgi:hypothetical protein